MATVSLKLFLLTDRFAVCRMDAAAVIPAWASTRNLCSITRTPDELSIVCLQDGVPDGVKSEKGWRCFMVEGPIEFSTVGVIASLATPLAQAGISIFVISTYDTDYLMVKEENMNRTIMLLAEAGYSVNVESE